MHAHSETLAVLVDRLVAFLEEQHGRHYGSLIRPVPDVLARVWDAVGPHLVALMLVANSDRQTLPAERDVILRYALEHIAATGLALTSEETSALQDYVHHFRPSLLELTPAVARLKEAPRSEIAALIDAAHNVVRADGKLRLQELSFLASLRSDLAALL